MKGRKQALAAALTTLAVGLHLVYWLHAGPLWRDEVGTVQLAKLPSLREARVLLTRDAFPALYPALLRLWIILGGDGDFWLRSLGFMLGLSLLAALWWNARVLGAACPFLSLGLLGPNLVLLRYGDSIRAYGLGSLLLLMSFGLIWRASCEPDRRRVALAGLAAVLSMQCLYQNVFLTAAVCLAGCVVSLRGGRRTGLWACLAIGLAAGLSMLPYAGPVLRAQQWTAIDTSDLDPAWMLSRLARALGPWAWMSGVWAGLCLSGACLGFGRPRCLSSPLSVQKREQSLFAAVALTAGMAGYLAFLKIAGLPTNPWHYIPLVTLAAVCLDASLGAGVEAAWLPLAAAAMFAIAFPSALTGVQARQTNMDLIAAKLEKTARRGDLILINPWYYAISFDRYYKGNVAWTALPALGDMRGPRPDLLKEKLAALDPLRPVIDQTARTLQSGGRVWLVGGLIFLEATKPPPNLPPAPQGPLGWNARPYLRAWSMQMGHFIRSHALRSEDLTPLSGPISPYENPRLGVVEGWRS